MFKFTENSKKFLRSVTWKGSMTWKMFLVTFIYGRSFELYIWWTFAVEFLLIAQWFPKLQSKIELSRPGKLFYSSFSPQPVTWFDKHKQSKLHNLPVGVNLPKTWLWAGYFPKVRKNDKKEKKSLNTLKAFLKMLPWTLYICDALRDLVSVTIWRLHDRSNAYQCMLTLSSTFTSFLSVCMS